MKKLIIIWALLIGTVYAQTNSGVFVVGGKAINVGDGIPNIFLATQSAFWNNANNWSLGRLPVTNQNVVIRANCTVDVSFTVKSLTVESTRTLSFNPFTGTVNNDFICNGNLNQSGFSSNLILNGANNSIAGTFTPGTTSTITYNRAGTQDVLNLPYNFLMFSQGGAAITRNLNAGVFFIKNSLTLGGTPSTTTINKADGADITFEGLLGLGNFTTLTTIGNVIIQNGIRAQATNATINCSTLIVRAISQQSFLNSQQGVFVNGNFLIENGLTFTNNFGNSFGVAGLNVSGSINGSNASSTFINNGYLVLNSLGSLMNTGVFTNNSGSTIQLSYAGTSNIPNYTYHNLWLSNTGTKSLSLNTTVNDLITSTNGILNIGNFDLTVNGIALIQGNNVVESLSTTGTGKLICVGQLQGNNFSMVNIGSNTIECRGGISTVQATSITLKSPVLFTTNNQNIQSTNGTDTRPVIFTNSVTINPLLTITQTTITHSFFTGVLNGVASTSILDNRGLVNYQNATAPMVTGQLQTNNAANTFKYNRAGVQDVKGGTYRTIEFGGSGVKTLLGNVIINTTAGGSQSTTGSASVNLNGFTITTI